MMNKLSDKGAGRALIIFILLIVLTMVMHPAGGGFAFLSRIAMMIIISHSIALASLPLGAIGFWGLTRRIGTDNFLAVTAFAFISFGLTAVLIAGATNGLVLPVFVLKYKGSSPETIALLKPMLAYNFSINTAFDYIYTGAFCLAILFWSVAILGARTFPSWIAYLGILTALSGVVIAIVGFSPASLIGVRLFILSMISWLIVISIYLTKPVATGIDVKI